MENSDYIFEQLMPCISSKVFITKNWKTCSYSSHAMHVKTLWYSIAEEEKGFLYSRELLKEKARNRKWWLISLSNLQYKPWATYLSVKSKGHHMPEHQEKNKCNILIFKFTKIHSALIWN